MDLQKLFDDAKPGTELYDKLVPYIEAFVIQYGRITAQHTRDGLEITGPYFGGQYLAGYFGDFITQYALGNPMKNGFKPNVVSEVLFLLGGGREKYFDKDNKLKEEHRGDLNVMEAVYQALEDTDSFIEGAEMIYE
jgi:hypothetical protein